MSQSSSLSFHVQTSNNSSRITFCSLNKGGEVHFETSRDSSRCGYGTVCPLNCEFIEKIASHFSQLVVLCLRATTITTRIERLNRTQKPNSPKEAPTIQYEIPTWNQIYDMLIAQAQKIQTSPYNPELIVAIARGGLVPARILADLLEVTQIATLQVEFYVDIAQTKAEPTIKHALTAPVQGKKVLLVDDIADTGKSLQVTEKYLKNQGAQEVRCATIYFKPQSVKKPDYFEKETDSWVIFPWDTKETLRCITRKQLGKRQANQEIQKIVKAGLPKQLADKLLGGMQEPK